MIQEILLYNWIKFNFSEKLSITQSRTGLFAVTNSSNNIIIWKQENQNYTEATGTLISIIVNQFEGIKQIKWLFNKDKLLINDQLKCYIWDPVENLPIETIEAQDDVLFCREFDEGYIIAFENGSLFCFGKGYEKRTPVSNGLIWNRENSIVVYPFEFTFQDGELTHLNLKMNRRDKQLRKSFRENNPIPKNCQFFVEKNLDDFLQPELPEHVIYRFEKAKLIYIKIFQNYTIFSTKTFTLIMSKINDQVNFLPLDTEKSIFQEILSDDPSLIRYTANAEKKIAWINDQLVINSIGNSIINGNINLENIPIYLQVNMNQEMKYARADFLSGFLWIPDYNEDHVFLDLMKGTGIIIPNTIYNTNSHLFVDKNSKFLLEWLPSNRYPEGKLILHETESEAIVSTILYDISNLPKGKSNNFQTSRIKQAELTEGEISEIDQAYPLIIPSWSYIKLFIFYNGFNSYQFISNSCLYLLLTAWSKSENAAVLSYSQDDPDDHAFVKFGDLEIVYKKKKFNFQGIAPLWEFDPELGILVTVSTDRRAYVWDLTSADQIPFADFKTNLPFSIKLAPNGKYIAVISFIMKKTAMQGKPNLNREIPVKTLVTDYPIIECIVFDMNLKKKFIKRFRFPTHLIRTNTEIQTQYEKEKIIITFPSFINIEDQVICTYSITDRKFRSLSKSNVKRYWQTHSKNSPFDQLGKGEEFPIDPHPEIKRETALRPFYLMGKNLVRKKDYTIISSGEVEGVQQPQISTNKFYSLENTKMLEMPFYKDKLREIHISTKNSKMIENINFIRLKKIEKLPLYSTVELVFSTENKLLLKRMEELIKKVIANRCLHNKYGLAFKSTKFDIFRSKLEVKLQEIESAINWTDS